jgi:L-malate glycosyltransferase
VALYSGRLVPIKRVGMLIRAVAGARRAGAPVRLVILGDGDLRPALEDLARGLGITRSVDFQGYREDVTPFVASGDIAVLSSANEGTPVALIEASAAGRPSVATRVGGVPDVVTDDTGILVDRDDLQGLTDALVRLAADAGLRRDLGRHAREHVRSAYSSLRLLADVDRLYGDLLATPRGRALRL